VALGSVILALVGLCSLGYIQKLHLDNYKNKSVIYKQSFGILRQTLSSEKRHFLILSGMGSHHTPPGNDLKSKNFFFYKLFFKKG
jgi:hypothetical protein